MKKIAYLQTPIGLIRLLEKDEKLCRIEPVRFQEFSEDPSLLLQEAKWQLEAYFDGKRKSFNIPLLIEGSDFAKEIYSCLLNTSYATTLTYKELATNAGSPDASRAVGTAMKKNPLPIIIPCHRVLKSDGTVGNYSGPGGVKSKNFLIEHEKSFSI